MALTKAQKSARQESLAAELQSATTLVLTSFSGLTVAQDYELRTQLRQVGARFRVVKNTLAARAAVGTPSESVLKALKGVHAVAYTSGDGVALAKTVEKYAKDNPQFQVRAGVVEGEAINAQGVALLAATPSKEELYSKLLFLLQAPSQRLVTVLQAVGRNTAVVLDQAVQAKKFSE